MDANFRIVHLDLVDDRAQPGAAEGRFSRQDILAHRRHKGRDALLGDARLQAQLADGPVKGRLRDIALGLHRREAVPQGRIIRVGNAGLNGLIEPAETAFGLRQLAAQRREAAGVVRFPLELALDEAMQQMPDALRRQQLLAETVGDDAVEALHRQRAARTGRLALLCRRGTDVVAVTARLAGADCHAAAAGRAGGKAGQQDRSGDDARRCHLGIARLEIRLHRIEHRRVDNRVDRHDDVLARGLGLARLGIPAIEARFALVDRVTDELVQRADAPSRSAARAKPALVEPGHGRLDTHRPARAVALAQQAEDETDGLGLDRVDGEALLGLRAALLGGDHLVAERRGGAVPEALAGVLLHGPQDVLGVLLGLVLVEQREHLTHHDAHRVVAKVLRHRHETDARLAQTPDMVLQREMVAREAAERMHDDGVERRAGLRCNVEQPLQLGALVVRARQARIDELRRHLPAARFTEGDALPPLVGNRQVALGLTASGNAQVQRRAQR